MSYWLGFYSQFSSFLSPVLCICLTMSNECLTDSEDNDNLNDTPHPLSSHFHWHPDCDHTLTRKSPWSHWPCSLHPRCFSLDVWTLLSSPVWASVSSWSVLVLWLVSLSRSSLLIGPEAGSQEGCVSECHKLVFKALYLLIKPTSEEFVTRTPALFVSLPKWSTRARPNLGPIDEGFFSPAFVMFEAFWGRSR